MGNEIILKRSSGVSMIFANGMTFLGRLNSNGIIKDACTLKILDIMGPEGPSAMATIQKCNDVTLVGSYASTDIDVDTETYASYIKVTTGLEVPKPKRIH